MDNEFEVMQFNESRKIRCKNYHNHDPVCQSTAFSPHCHICFKHILLISKQVKNIKWTPIRRWEMEYWQWMENTHSQKTNITDTRLSYIYSNQFLRSPKNFFALVILVDENFVCHILFLTFPFHKSSQCWVQPRLTCLSTQSRKNVLSLIFSLNAVISSSFATCQCVQGDISESSINFFFQICI